MDRRSFLSSLGLVSTGAVTTLVAAQKPQPQFIKDREDFYRECVDAWHASGDYAAIRNQYWKRKHER